MVAFAALAPIIAAGVGAAGSLMSGKMSSDAASSAATDQYGRSLDIMNAENDFNQWMYQHRYQMTAEDMVAAGLNPIMAASGGFSVGGAPSSHAPQIAEAYPISYPSFASSARDFADVGLKAIEMDRQEAERKKVVEETARAHNEAKESLDRAARERAQTELFSAQERETVQKARVAQEEVREVAARIRKMENEIDEIQARRGLEVAEQRNVEEARGLIAKEKEELGERIRALRYQMAELSNISEVYDGAVGKVLTYLKAIADAIGLKTLLGAAMLRGGSRRPVRNFRP